MHFQAVNFGSLSFLLISHFIWPVPTVKLLFDIMDMFFSASIGVYGSSYTDFDHFLHS
jgi:hypothetical protein